MFSALKRRSTSFRIGLLFAATFAVGLLLAFGATYVLVSYSLERANHQTLASKAQEFAAVLNTSGVDGLKRELQEEPVQLQNAHILIRVVGVGGEVLIDKRSVQKQRFDFDAAFRDAKPESLLGWHNLEAYHDEDLFELLGTRLPSGLLLQVGKSNEDTQDILETLTLTFAIAAGVLSLLGAGLGFWYARRSLRPLRELAFALRQVEEGRFERRLPLPETRDELYDLAFVFNAMTSRLESLVRVMRESLDHVAHDIRTPLTRLRLVAEDALSATAADIHRHALEDCAEASGDISELVDQWLSISEADSGTLALKIASQDVRALLAEVCEVYEFVALEKKIKLNVHVKTDLRWNLDAKRVKQMIGNLVDNALKYSPAGTSVELRARIENGNLVVTVEDEGPGVAREDLNRIWDRLYRGDKTRNTKGAGLGLSIVRSIASAHGGEARAQTRAHGGMEFSLELPPR